MIFRRRMTLAAHIRLWLRHARANGYNVRVHVGATGQSSHRPWER